MATIEINRPVGYAVRVGKLWAKESFGDIALVDNPSELYSLDRAYEQAERTSGDIYSFYGTKLSEADLMGLRDE